MPRVNFPDLSNIKPGLKALYSAKIGGECVLLDVMVKSKPYQRDYGKGRKAWYVDAFGYGWKGSVPVKKLWDKAKFAENISP